MTSTVAKSHILTTDPIPPQAFLYHFTSRASLRAILETGNLRLSSLALMNDPRERREWIADKSQGRQPM